MDWLLGGGQVDAPTVLLPLALALVFGLMTALVARSRGRSFLVWLVYGTLVPGFALIHSLFLAPGKAKDERGLSASKALRRCPFCFESIRPDREVCPACWRVLPAENGAASMEPDVPDHQ